ncbi:MAG: hypothetical protein AAF628_20625 [Planctomycetota bacterium]
MRTSLFVAAALAGGLFALPATAQFGGSVNRKAPKVEQSITFGDAALKLTYRSFSWAEGRFMDALMADDERGAASRERVNKRAEGNPMGGLETTAAFQMGGKTVPAGKYNLFFQIDEDRKWHLVAAGNGSDARVDWALPSKDSPLPSPRLVCALRAGVADGTGVLNIAFGSTVCRIELSPGSGDQSGTR